MSSPPLCKKCGKLDAVFGDGMCANCHAPRVVEAPAVEVATLGSLPMTAKWTDEQIAHVQQQAIEEDARRACEIYGKLYACSLDPNDKPREVKAMSDQAWKPSEDAILREEWAKGYGASGRAAQRLEGRSKQSVLCRANKLGLKRAVAAKDAPAVPKGNPPRPPSAPKAETKPMTPAEVGQVVHALTVALGHFAPDVRVLDAGTETWFVRESAGVAVVLESTGAVRTFKLLKEGA